MILKFPADRIAPAPAQPRATKTRRTPRPTPKDYRRAFESVLPTGPAPAAKKVAKPEPKKYTAPKPSTTQEPRQLTPWSDGRLEVMIQGKFGWTFSRERIPGIIDQIEKKLANNLPVVNLKTPGVWLRFSREEAEQFRRLLVVELDRKGWWRIGG